VEIPDFGSSLVDVAIRTSIIYVVLIGGLRIAGKREVGQLSIFDLIVLLVIADAVQNAMVGENTTLAGGIVAAVTLLSLDKLLAIASQRSARLRTLLEGEPRELIRDGAVDEDALHKEGIDDEDLKRALRVHGLLDPSDVALAVLETDGTISVVPRRTDDATRAVHSAVSATQRVL
jgi:uncharacterized membrane protein YcaP (DUF421 family)